MPRFPSVLLSDARAIYSQGYNDGAEEIATIEDVMSWIPGFLSRYTLRDKT